MVQKRDRHRQYSTGRQTGVMTGCKLKCSKPLRTPRLVCPKARNDLALLARPCLIAINSRVVSRPRMPRTRSRSCGPETKHNHEISPHSKHTAAKPPKPQKHGDRGQLEMACDETIISPTRYRRFTHFCGRRVCVNRYVINSTALTLSNVKPATNTAVHRRRIILYV